MANAIKTEPNLISSTNDCIFWTRDETNLLLSVVMEKNILKLFNEKKHPRIDILKIIENEFHKYGFINKNTHHIDDKWKSLTELFRYAEKSNIFSGGISKKCPYYDELEKIFKISSENVKNMFPSLHVEHSTNCKTESIKCGEIFYVNNNLKYNCFLCESVEENSQKFEEHFYAKHLNDLSSRYFSQTNQTDFDYHKIGYGEPISVELVEVKEEFDETLKILPTKNNENLDLDNTSALGATSSMLDADDAHSEIDFFHDDLINSTNASDTAIDKQYCGIFHDDGFLIEQNKMFKCLHCDMIFKAKKPMNDHFNKLKKFNCSECGLGFCGQKRYRDHLNFGHIKIDPISNKQPFLICDFCKMKLKDRPAYRKHMIAFKNLIFNCTECGKQFCGSKRYREHITTTHNIKQQVNNNQIQSAMLSFMCYICKISTKNKRNLKLHMRRHTGEKPYKCTLCDKAFAANKSLQLHTHHYHTFERPFMCTECGTCFAFQRILNAHVRRHRQQEESPKPCPICSKIIKNSERLQIHLKIHTDERNFICKVCDRTFKTRRSYRQHLLIHSEERKFPCQFCGLSFTQSAGRRGHVRRVHEGIK